MTDMLVNDIKSSTFFAMMLDESTDIGVEKPLSICMRYVKHSELTTSFLSNLPLENGCATTIVNCVRAEFQKLGISLDKCVSLATDGAAITMGHKTQG